MIPPGAVFLGYWARLPWVPGGQWHREATRHITRVCSLGCLVDGADAEGRFEFNRARCYTTETLAVAEVLPENRERFSLFAFWLVPFERTTDGSSIALTPDMIFPPGDPLPPDDAVARTYRFLGFDVVATNGTRVHGYACSPLSCNVMVERLPANRDCLFEDLESALEAGRVWTHGLLSDSEQPSEGHYVVIAVAEKARAQSTFSPS